MEDHGREPNAFWPSASNDGQPHDLIRFELIRSATHAGFDFTVATGAAVPHVIASNIPDVRAALLAIVDAFTAPLIDRDRLNVLDESTAAIPQLLDRVTELEERFATVVEQNTQTRDALIRMMAGGGQFSTTAPPLKGQQFVTGMSIAQAPAPPRVVEEGFAGTFRQPLADSVHGVGRTSPSGHPIMAGGAFAGPGSRQPLVIQPPRMQESGGDEEEG